MDLRAFVPHGRTVGITKTKRRKKLLLVMKLTAFILLAGMLHVSAAGWGQTVTLSEKNVPVQQVFKEISRQTGISILYNEQFLAGLSKVTIEVKNATIEQVLKECLKNQPLTYSIQNNKILIQQAAEIQSAEFLPPPVDIHGRVTDSLGNPLSGASIYIKGTKRGTITDANGYFTLKGLNETQSLVVTFTGYTRKEYKINAGSDYKVVLNKSNDQLDQVVVIPYGTTTQRLSTGDISTVGAKVIEEQPVSNPLAALEGRVPGLVVTQLTGVPGGAFKVQIRGQNSIANGTDPLYVVDGVPYNSQIPAGGLINDNLQGGSTLNYINPYDIESIEVLKDADATAIYGSRAANGAIIITTKKGKEGTMKVDVNVNSGLTTAAHDLTLLNTQQYLAMRREAFQNDGASPGPGDHDINGDWDTTRYTNWSKTLTQNTAHYTDANISLSGGNANTQYLVEGGYNNQTTGYPTLISDQGVDQKASAHFNLNTVSPDKRFKFNLTTNYVSNKNTIQLEDYSANRLYLAPDAPAIFNSDGSLNWAPLNPGEGRTWANPYASLYEKYNQQTSNLISNAVIGYTLLRGLELKASLGYTNTQIDEIHTIPLTSFDPGEHRPSGYTFFNEIGTNSWIIEPQADYKVQLGKGILSALVGTTFLGNKSNQRYNVATGFISDALLEDIGAASTVRASGGSGQYKYQALFGRLSYNWEDKYLINLNGRRDGSSRFGPGKQFANFGAIGAGWIFSREHFVQDALKFLSYGKIRASYGSTGNDQVGDYKFLDLYGPTIFPYQGAQGLTPANLFNPNLSWEETKKAELGIELGFIKDRITFIGSIYQNRTNNQLISVPISEVTGFPSIPSNLPATVQNAGEEFVLNTLNIKSKNFSWSSSINLTISRNKLISYPGLATSPYKDILVIGQPLTILKLYQYAGINANTGLYQFKTAQGGVTSSPNYLTDLTALGDITPQYYGGFQNSFSYKGISFDIFFQFVKQKGVNLFGANNQYMPGMMSNQAVEVLNRWQKPGDQKANEQYSQTYGSDAYNAFSYALGSDYAYSDASFIRLKNISLSWQLPDNWKKEMHLINCRVYFQAQNLLTITSYQGFDPESQGIGTGPRRVWVGGLQITL